MNQKSDTKPAVKNKWMWTLGIALVFIVLFVPPALFRLLYSYAGYGYGWHMMPMMYGGGMTPFHGALGFGMMLFMWLISLASLVLIGLGIAWLVKTLTDTK